MSIDNRYVSNPASLAVLTQTSQRQFWWVEYRMSSNGILREKVCKTRFFVLLVSHEWLREVRRICRDHSVNEHERERKRKRKRERLSGKENKREKVKRCYLIKVTSISSILVIVKKRGISTKCDKQNWCDFSPRWSRKNARHRWMFICHFLYHFIFRCFFFLLKKCHVRPSVRPMLIFRTTNVGVSEDEKSSN